MAVASSATHFIAQTHFDNAETQRGHVKRGTKPLVAMLFAGVTTIGPVTNRCGTMLHTFKDRHRINYKWAGPLLGWTIPRRWGFVPPKRNVGRISGATDSSSDWLAKAGSSTRTFRTLAVLVE